MSQSEIQALSGAVERLFAAADERTAAFSRVAGVSCPPGCGACCARPGGVEARVAEMLPAAFALLERSGPVADAVYERAAADPDGRCAFFVPEFADGARGKCAHYDLRPGLCRLFGFASARDKYGRPQLSTCAILRTPALGARVERGELTPPAITSVGDAVAALAGAGSGLGELLPINRALTAALTRAYLARAT